MNMNERFPSGNLAPSGDTAKNPLDSIAYTYDGSLEGLLSAVFESYVRREVPSDITPSSRLQPRLGQRVLFVETDINKALRVRQGVCRYSDEETFDDLRTASVSDDPHTGTIVYAFIRHVMNEGPKQGCFRPLSDILHPAVEPLLALRKSVLNERHRMIQFMRFEHLEGGLWFARCNPQASVVPLLMDWFSARFNTQPFIIYDEEHDLAGVYEGTGWHLVRSDIIDIPERTADEISMQRAWKRFYKTVAVESRYNPELRRSFMPKRLWKNITEMREDLPTDGLLSPR